MAMDPSKKVENDSDTLSPVTVKVGDVEDSDADDADDIESQQADDAEGQPGQGGQPAPARPAPRPGQPPTPGQPPRQGAPSRPSKFVSRRDLDQATQTISQLQQTIAEMRGQLQALTQMRPQQGGAEPPSQEQTQLKNLAVQMNGIIAQSRNPDLTPEQVQQLTDQFNQLSAQREELQWAVREKALIKTLKSELQTQQQDPRDAAWAASIAQEFPQLTENPRAVQMAQIKYDELLQKNGGRESYGLMRQACAWSVRVNQLGNLPGPGPGDRGRHAGVNGQGGPRQSPNTFTFTPEQLRMMRGAPVSPEQVAAQMMLDQEGGD